MSRISFVNGWYMPHSDADVHIADRGYQFGDGEDGAASMALTQAYFDHIANASE
jgi:branched-subunit amino acid aminotransferase/4-amino-4-deoxychorismate lyase